MPLPGTVHRVPRHKQYRPHHGVHAEEGVRLCAQPVRAHPGAGWWGGGRGQGAGCLPRASGHTRVGVRGSESAASVVMKPRLVMGLVWSNSWGGISHARTGAGATEPSAVCPTCSGHVDLGSRTHHTTWSQYQNSAKHLAPRAPMPPTCLLCPAVLIPCIPFKVCTSPSHHMSEDPTRKDSLSRSSSVRGPSTTSRRSMGPTSNWGAAAATATVHQQQRRQRQHQMRQGRCRGGAGEVWGTSWCRSGGTCYCGVGNNTKRWVRQHEKL